MSAIIPALDVIAALITVGVILLVIFGIVLLVGLDDPNGSNDMPSVLRRGIKGIIRTLACVIAVCAAIGGTAIVLTRGWATLLTWIF